MFTECSEPLTVSCPSVGLALTAAVFSHSASAMPLGKVWLIVKVTSFSGSMTLKGPVAVARSAGRFCSQ